MIRIQFCQPFPQMKYGDWTCENVKGFAGMEFTFHQVFISIDIIRNLKCFLMFQTTGFSFVVTNAKLA